MAFCVVTDSYSESEDKAFLPALASAVNWELTDVTKPNERTEDLLESKNPSVLFDLLAVDLFTSLR